MAEDADIEMVVRSVTFACVGTAGQRCTTLRRLIVHERFVLIHIYYSKIFTLITFNLCSLGHFTKKFKNFVIPRIFLRFLRPRAKKRFYQNFFCSLGPKKVSIRIFFCALGPKSVLFHEKIFLYKCKYFRIGLSHFEAMRYYYYSP